MSLAWCVFSFAHDLQTKDYKWHPLTNGDFFDDLSGRVRPLHEGSRPWWQIPVGLHSEDVGLDAPARSSPSGKHQVWTLGGRTAGAAWVNQSGENDDTGKENVIEGRKTEEGFTSP